VRFAAGDADRALDPLAVDRLVSGHPVLHVDDQEEEAGEEDHEAEPEKAAQCDLSGVGTICHGDPQTARERWLSPGDSHAAVSRSMSGDTLVLI
jgi:hypothetical protein